VTVLHILKRDLSCDIIKYIAPKEVKSKKADKKSTEKKVTLKETHEAKPRKFKEIKEKVIEEVNGKRSEWALNMLIVLDRSTLMESNFDFQSLGIGLK
jgi:uncharacterized membrane protein YkoI